MFVKQLSVFIENKHGRLAEMLKTLNENNIDIQALSIADTTEFGIARMIVNDTEKAKAALRESGVVVKTTDVIALKVEDTPGGLSKAVDALTEAGIAIEYIYAFVGKEKQKALVVMRCDKQDEAISVLKNAQITIVTAETVKNL